MLHMICQLLVGVIISINVPTISDIFTQFLQLPSTYIIVVFISMLYWKSFHVQLYSGGSTRNAIWYLTRVTYNFLQKERMRKSICNFNTWSFLKIFFLPLLIVQELSKMSAIRQSLITAESVFLTNFVSTRNFFFWKKKIPSRREK